MVLNTHRDQSMQHSKTAQFLIPCCQSFPYLIHPNSNKCIQLFYHHRKISFCLEDRACIESTLI